MMKPENKSFIFQNILDVPQGYWRSNIEELDYDYWVNQVYDYQKYNPNSVNRSNNGGYQSESNIQNEPIFFPLVNLLLKKVKPLTENYNNKIQEMWVNISKTGNYNSPHTHGFYEDRFLSGIIYLKTPPNCGELIFLNPIAINYRHVVSDIKERDLIIFPNSLPHHVAPNNSKEDRISIAFNYG